MKVKLIFLVTVFLFVGGFSVFAGGQRDDRVEIRTGGGTVGGVFFVQAAAVASIVNRYVPEVNFTAQTTAHTGESFNRLARRSNMEAFVGNADFVYIGARGGNPDVPLYTAANNVRAWFVTEAAPFLLIARTDNANVTTFEDIWRPGARVGTGTTGGSSHNLLLNISRFMGHDPAAMNVFNAGHDVATSALRDRNIDLLFAGSGSLSAPNSAYLELAAGTRISTFNMPEELRTMVINESPYFGKFTLAPGWLPGHDEPTDVVAMKNGFFLEETVSADVVYRMTRAIFENLDELRSIAYAPFRTLGPQTAANGAVVPFHPGALRFFQQAGFEISYQQ